MKIGSRLILGFAVCLVFFVLLGGLGIYELQDISSRSSKVIDVNLKLVENALGLQTNINLLRRYEKDAFINLADPAKVDEYVKKWGEARDNARKRLDVLTKLDQDPKSKEVLAGINDSLDSYETGFKRVADQIKSGSITTTQDANKAIGEFKEATHQSEKQITDYAVTSDEHIETVKTGLDADVTHAIFISLIIIAFAFVIVLTMVTLLIRSIKRPLTQIQDLVNDIAQGEGDLTKRLHYSGNDELGAICGSFNQFIEKLRNIISQVAESAVQIASASNQLHSTAEQIATGAEEVASQTCTVATASEEMAATSSDIARNCSMAAESSQQTSASATRGGTVVQETIAGMGRIAERVKRSAETVANLGLRSEQIGEIVGTIEDIADQTNLLALNAAIEAARAGDQGRGFAVVADEVRALAERTTKATKEISVMIKAIQNETKAAVQAMEEGVSEVEKGAESSEKSGQALEEILTQINEVTMQINQIATAAEEQTATTSEITSNVQQVTDVVQQTARGASETATASAQLSSNAQMLQELVGRFKLA